MKLILSFFSLNVLVLSATASHVEFGPGVPSNPAFDPSIYVNALDTNLCHEQLSYIRSNNTNLLLTFLEAGMRLPKAVLQWNNLDLGNYDQCLGLNYHQTEESNIQGKYCLIRVPLNSENINSLSEALNMKHNSKNLNPRTLSKFKEIEGIKTRLRDFVTANQLERTFSDESNEGLPTFRLALCVPKTCTSQEGIDGLYFNLTQLGFRYQEEFCRIKDDKPWVPADYLAITIFSIIGLLTIISTLYDVWHQFIVKTEPKTINVIGRSFSVFTNGKALTTFSKNPNNLNCIDGIRAISMFWIILGHSYSLSPPTYNNNEVIDWMFSLGSQWVMAAPFAVDTFFFLAGLLLVYTTAKKFTSMQLLKNLHVFYLSRLLRMFPILAAIILLQASVFHRVTDGPLWNDVAMITNNCRINWWLTLLYVQNYVNTPNSCIYHSWYLAIDMQCYFVSPIILFWVLSGKRKHAWTALTIGLLISLTIAATFCFIYQFQGWFFAAPREGGNQNYNSEYYINTLTRAPAFFTGMPFGYLLHTWRDRKPQIPKYVAAFLWFCVAAIGFILPYTTYLMKDFENWPNVNGIVNDFFNSFARPLWVVPIGWIIFACQHGYAGPVNWFLSLEVWKLPSRVSYAMYLFHYQLQFIIQGTARQPFFFDEPYMVYKFLSQAVIIFGVSFILTLVIDAPFALFTRLLFEGRTKKKESADKE